LGSSRVLLLEHGRADLQRRVRLNCSQASLASRSQTEQPSVAVICLRMRLQDDVFFALRDDKMAQAMSRLLAAQQSSSERPVAPPTTDAFEEEEE
jgi:hypothetical protein